MIGKINEKLSYVKNILKTESPKKYVLVFALMLASMIICELFVFNFKWAGSLFDKQIDIQPIMKSGFSQAENGGYRVEGDAAVIEFQDLNSEIKYLYFRPGRSNGTVASIVIFAADEANENFLAAPERKVLYDVERSQYIRLHFSGNVKTLRILINGMANEVIDCSCFGLNVNVPLMFSWLRLLIMTLLGMLIYILRPSSFVYKYKTDMKKPGQRVTAAFLLVVYAVIFWNTINWNTTATDWHKSLYWHYQYYDLVDAFKDGHLYISDDVSDTIKNMENPYDTGARQTREANYRWDTAYYNGKYYCYFGAGPAALLYLPYNLITGGNLPNYIAAYIFGVMILIGIMLLLWEIIKKWYPQTPFVIFLLLWMVFSAVSVTAYLSYCPSFYAVPVTAALMFALFGLAFWISAERKLSADNDATLIIKWRLALGSICIALTALCRPHFLITALFGVMLFWSCVFKKRTLFSKKSIKQTLALCLPFVIIGAITMLYNAARFGSPFDFGANYNLTSNDMTHRGFVFGRIGLGIFTYLLQPIKFDAVFPFLHDFAAVSSYQGLTLSERLIGGVLWLYPILFIGIYGVFKKKLFADKCAYKMTYMSVMFAVIIAVADAQMAGLLPRYFMDFVWLIMLAVSFTVFALCDKSAGMDSSEKTAVKITLALSYITLALAFLSIFAYSENSILSANPKLYYTLQHLIAFWM